MGQRVIIYVFWLKLINNILNGVGQIVIYDFIKYFIKWSELIYNIKNYDGIIFYSLFQLPEKKENRNAFYNVILYARRLRHCFNKPAAPLF